MMPPNKSPEPTAVGALRSAVAVHAASRRWLSFLRGGFQAGLSAGSFSKWIAGLLTKLKFGLGRLVP